MIYRDREVRLLRGVVAAVAFTTLAVAGLTYIQNANSVSPVLQEEIIAAVVLSVLLYVAGEWLLPTPLLPPRTPRPAPSPIPIRAWRRDPPAAEPPSAGLNEGSDRPRSG